MRLDAAVVAITGAGRGIGRATARAFAERGASVALGDLDAEPVAEAARIIGPSGRAFEVDVTSRESFAAFLESARSELGSIDVLVNNAGVMPAGRFLDEDEATGEATLDVNLRGPIIGMRLALPGMVERGRGHVVNVASMLGKIPAPGLAVYAASKHGVVGLSASMHEELAGTGVTVSCVMPTAVRTELSSGLPLDRLAPVEAEDVAAAIVASCDRPLPEISVPRWADPAARGVAFTPAPVTRAIRRLMGSRRVLQSLDEGTRKGYEDRLRRQRQSQSEGSAQTL